MVPQRWIIDCRKMYKISDEVIKFIENSIENWRGKRFNEVKIQRGNFQRNALSPLLFVIVMMPLNHLGRKCTG